MAKARDCAAIAIGRKMRFWKQSESMRFFELVPEAVKDYIRIVSARRRYPGCNIGTPYLSPDVVLGDGCSLSRNVELGPGVRIGDCSYLNSGTIVASGRSRALSARLAQTARSGWPTTLWNFSRRRHCLYGPRNVFGDGSHWEHYGAAPEIGCDVWIGARVFIGTRCDSGARSGSSAGRRSGSKIYRLTRSRRAFPPRLAPIASLQPPSSSCFTSAGGNCPFPIVHALRAEFLTPLEREAVHA